MTKQLHRKILGFAIILSFVAGFIPLIINASANANAVHRNIPILMYHTSVEELPKVKIYESLYVKPSEFDIQIKYLSENGFSFCTFDDYNNLHEIDKPVFITFDDGYYENYTEIFPILKKYNAKITIFITIKSIETRRLTEDIIKEMSDSGLVKFESHTVSHINLLKISDNDEKLTDELKTSKEKIEEITQKTVVALAYPNGAYDDIIKKKAREYYSFALTSLGGMHNTKEDLFSIVRIPIDRYIKINVFKQLIEFP